MTSWRSTHPAAGDTERPEPPVQRPDTRCPPLGVTSGGIQEAGSGSVARRVACQSAAAPRRRRSARDWPAGRLRHIQHDRVTAAEVELRGGDVKVVRVPITDTPAASSATATIPARQPVAPRHVRAGRALPPGRRDRRRSRHRGCRVRTRRESPARAPPPLGPRGQRVLRRRPRRGEHPTSRASIGHPADPEGPRRAVRGGDRACGVLLSVGRRARCQECRGRPHR